MKKFVTDLFRKTETLQKTLQKRGKWPEPKWKGKHLVYTQFSFPEDFFTRVVKNIFNKREREK